MTLEVNPGEIVTIIGANGAGKTTLLRAISGVYRPQRGTISFENRDIAGWAPDKIVGLGISQVPEGRQVFVQQSVAVNLELGAFPRRRQPQ
ncbi:MAG: ATP-binding cassette domain-containing protein, partial [Chloroflexi bacterium]|nr:ATP-binding cassette domain-containing protein [Chloroflexota bacterium]